MFLNLRNDIKFIKYLILPLLIFLFFFNFYAYYVTKVPIRFWDEHGWIGRSYFFELFIKRDFNNPLWQTYYSYDEPKLGEYLYGLMLYPSYLKKRNVKNKEYDTAKFLIDNNFYQIHSPIYQKYREEKSNFIEWGKMPFEDFDVSAEYLINKYGQRFAKTINIIFTARKANVFILAFNIVIVYFITSVVFNRLVALLTVFFYGLNNFVVTAGLRAQSEGLFLLLFNLALLLFIQIFTDISKKKKVLKNLVLFSVINGLLIQTKLNGIIILIFFVLLSFLVMGANFINKKYSLIKNNILSILVVVSLSSSIFFSLHPFLYTSPVKNTFLMYKLRYNEAQRQARERPSDYLSSFKDRITAIYANFLGRNMTDHYYNLVLFNGFFKIKPSYNQFLKLAFFILGLFSLVKRIFQKNKLFNPASLFLISFLLIQMTMGLYLVLDWDRYYIQLVLFFVLFQSIGLYESTRFLLMCLSYIFRQCSNHRVVGI